MATISFTQEVIVKDAQVIEQIRKDMQNYEPAFKNIKPDTSEDRTKEVSKIWCKR
ncbi:MAG: hypothetical protein R3Y45_08380 [Bacillota bacterium]